MSKRAVQKYTNGVRSGRGGQNWATFLSNHADHAWACDFIQTYEISFRQVYAFFIDHLGSRKDLHTGACRNPTREWTTRRLRNATMDGEAPRILLRDRDDKYGLLFDRAAKGAGIRVINTAVRAANVNVVAERFVGSARREMLDHVLVLDEAHLGRLVRECQQYFNEARPQQGIGQRVPGRQSVAADVTRPVVVRPVLGGLHHDYRRDA